MSGPYFETWSHENLVRFAQEAYKKLQHQEKELQKLREELTEEVERERANGKDIGNIAGDRVLNTRQFLIYSKA